MQESKIFSYDHWVPRAQVLKQRFLAAKPYPHVVFDDFLQLAAAEMLLADFPAATKDEWNHYTVSNVKKLAINNPDHFGEATKAVIGELNSATFVNFLRMITDIEQLMPDAKLEGGGLHQIERGGHLNIHADFTVHPHHRDWQRRLNLIVYLNKGWAEEYGGQLQLWDKGMRNCLASIAPLFNRAVVFRTDSDAFHGHPDPLACPTGISRKSMALFYFTKELAPAVRSTNFQARPEDGVIKAVGINLEKQLLRIYDLAKRAFGFDDKFVTKILKSISRKKK